MKEKLYRFMRSRYGMDALSGFLTWTGVILMLLDCFVSIGIFYLIGIICFIYGYVRILSKKYEKRAAQNKWFLDHTLGIRSIFIRRKKDKQAGKDYKVFNCRKCHQMIRVPKGKGKIKITCPKCGNSFIKKT